MILDIQAPIRINNTILKFKSLDAEGRWIEFEELDDNTGFGEGFIIPFWKIKYKGLKDIQKSHYCQPPAD
jgi:hypothetical protein